MQASGAAAAAAAVVAAGGDDDDDDDDGGDDCGCFAAVAAAGGDEATVERPGTSYTDNRDYSVAVAGDAVAIDDYLPVHVGKDNVTFFGDTSPKDVVEVLQRQQMDCIWKNCK
uniref:Putative secreted protein n=1 Tax=Anopheles darlingi TaxID=43151 RepID=A0A2M4DLQ2_ANODA